MVEEAPAASETSGTITEQTPAEIPKIGETLETQGSFEATIESEAQGGTDSTCNNNDNAESSALAPDVDREKTLEFADELAERGSKAFRDNDFAEAAECFSRSLEIRVAHYGEIALECLDSYYQYGRALLYKAQEEADPLGSVPNKEGEAQKNLDREGSVKSAVNGESSVASVSSSKAGEEGAEEGGKNEEEDEGVSDGDDEAEGDEDESDLDLAWKMLDVARAIAEKHQVGDTTEKVGILSALAEVALEREDFDCSLSDYQEAISILQRLVESDDRQLAELNFRICLCLEIGSKPQEAIPYCQNAISVCKSRLERLKNEVNSSLGSAISSAVSELDDGAQQSSNGLQSAGSVTDKEKEIKTLGELSEDLEKKLEDLQQLVSNPKSILSEILGIMSARGKDPEKSASPGAVINSSLAATSTNNGNFNSPTVSSAPTNGSAGVTHLGVVGRGVKRMNAGATESSPAKKPAINPSSDK